MSILDEAKAVVVDRQEKYGPPGAHWRVTVGLINSYFNINLRPEDWAVCMIFDKLAREAHSHNRDNMVDVAGYANGRAVVLDCSSGNCEEMHCKCGKSYRYVFDESHPTGKTLEEVHDAG